MAKQLVADLREGQEVAAAFVAQKKSLRDLASKPGKFLSLTLSDRTGEVPAVMWDNAERAASLFQDGDLVYVEGSVGTYQGKPQVRIDRLAQRKPEEVDLADFVARSQRDPQEMLSELWSAAKSVHNPFLNKLLAGYFGDPEFCARLLDAPAAKGLHHAYVGGLLDHLTTCLRIAEGVCSVHPQLDRDLVITGILLHDMGKLEELSVGLSIDYTPKGRLVGHIVLGALEANKRMDAISGFPEELRMLVTHIILAHHNLPEFGSPVPPMTAEAVAVHFIENCDAQVARFASQIQKARDAGEMFTEYDRLLERYLYAGPPQAE